MTTETKNPENLVAIKEAKHEYQCSEVTLKSWARKKVVPTRQESEGAPYFFERQPLEDKLRASPRVRSKFHPKDQPEDETPSAPAAEISEPEDKIGPQKELASPASVSESSDVTSANTAPSNAAPSNKEQKSDKETVPKKRPAKPTSKRKRQDPYVFATCIVGKLPVADKLRFRNKLTRDLETV